MSPTRLETSLLLAALLACGGGSPTPAAQQPAPSAPAPVADAPVILALGDSLTAGLGVLQSQAWPSLLQARLAAAGHRHRVVNASVSGDTSAGGLARPDWQFGEESLVLDLEVEGRLIRAILPQTAPLNLLPWQLREQQVRVAWGGWHAF